MNIFVLDLDPVRAAQMQCDKHVVKMTLETAQILSTVAHQIHANVELLYSPTHTNHPCVRWAARSSENYRWLLAHGAALAAEYGYRYGKIHASGVVISRCADAHVDDLLPIGGLTSFEQCMAKEHQRPDPVEAYRTYYQADKSAIASWTKREPPIWWTLPPKVAPRVYGKRTSGGNLNVAVPTTLLDAIREEAEKQGVTQAEVVRQALILWMRESR